MGKLKLVSVFLGAATLSGALTLAPKVHAYWKQVQAIECTPYQTGFGFAGPTTGDMWVSGSSVANTGYRSFNLYCPARTDDRTFPAESTTGWPTPIVQARFWRWYPASQVPRIQACGFYGCTYWAYGDPALDSWAQVYVSIYAGPWRPESYNTVVVGLDATDQDWGRVMFFDGFTVGSEPGPIW